MERPDGRHAGLAGRPGAAAGRRLGPAGAGGGRLPQYSAFYDRAAYNAPAYQAALLLLGLAVFSAYYGGLSRGLRPGSLVGGALVLVAGLLGMLQWRATSSAFLLSLPLLAATLAWGLRLRRAGGPGRQPTAGVGEWLLALPAVALLTQVIYLLLIIFGLGNLALVALLLLAVLLGLVLPVLLPVLTRPAGVEKRRPASACWALPGLALTGAVVALAVGHFTRLPTPDQPQQTHLYYTLDATHGRAYWLSAAARPDAWTRHALSRPQLGPLPALFPAGGPVLHQDAPAPAAGRTGRGAARRQPGRRAAVVAPALSTRPSRR
ncbi:MAG: hypothetical protein WKG07_33160 [Hymenobacter sp.]